MRTFRIAQRTVRYALWGPKWEGNPEKKAHTHTHTHTHIADSLHGAAEINKTL